MIFHWTQKEFFFEPDNNTFEVTDGFMWFKGYFFYREVFFTGQNAANWLFHNVINRDNFDYNELNGIYSTILFSSDHHKVIILNDRFGFRPLYYFQTSDEFILSDDYWQLCQRKPDIQIDKESVCDYLKYTYVLDDRSLVKDILFLKPACYTQMLIENSTCSFQSKTYWDVTYSPKTISKNEAISKIHNQLTSIIKKYSYQIFTPDKKIGINLTGGIDSRLLLALMMQNNLSADKLIAFTYGHPKADDQIITSKITGRLNIKHEKIVYGDEFFDFFDRDSIDKLIEINGFTNYFSQAYGVNRLSPLYRDVDYLITGSDGFIFGNFISQSLLDIKDENQLAEFIYASTTQACPTKILADLEMQQSAKQWIYQHIINGDALKGKDPVSAYFNWVIRNKPPKFLMSTIELLNKNTNLLLPYYDYEFIDLMLSLPSEMLMNQQAYINCAYTKVFTGEYNWLQSIPVEKRGLPKKKKDDCVFYPRHKKLTYRIKRKLLGTIDYSFPFSSYAFYRKNRTACMNRIRVILDEGSNILSIKRIQQTIRKHSRDERFFNYGLVILLSLLRVESKINHLTLKKKSDD